MKRTALIIICTMLLATNGMAQLIPLYESEGGSTLYLNPSRIYSYNLYEKSRWGAGLRYDIALGGKTFKTLSLSGYGAYGYGDERFKWGLKSDLLWNSKVQTHTYAEIFHDLTSDASRNLNDYQLTSFTSTSCFMTRRFSDTYRLILGFSQRFLRQFTGSMEVRLSRERPLYNNNTLFYPTDREALLSMPHNDFAELRLLLSHTTGWQTELVAGIVSGMDDYRFVRLLSQYDHTLFFSVLKLHLFVQGGITTNETPYSRIFDLGGIWSSPLSMDRTLLTVRPNEFTANLFGLTNIKLSLQNPLFSVIDHDLRVGLSPTPFLRLGAAWGHLSAKATGLTAPDKGLFEAGAGIDGLLVWGAVEWGAAVAYRLTPSSVSYHYADIEDNLVWMLTARLNL